MCQSNGLLEEEYSKASRERYKVRREAVADPIDHEIGREMRRVFCFDPNGDIRFEKVPSNCFGFLALVSRKALAIPRTKACA